MLSDQFLDMRSSTIPPDADEQALPGAMWLAGAGIGLAPAIAAVGVLSGGGLLALGASATVLAAGIIGAVLCSDK